MAVQAAVEPADDPGMVPVVAEAVAARTVADLELTTVPELHERSCTESLVRERIGVVHYNPSPRGIRCGKTETASAANSNSTSIPVKAELGLTN